MVNAASYGMLHVYVNLVLWRSAQAKKKTGSIFQPPKSLKLHISVTAGPRAKISLFSTLWVIMIIIMMTTLNLQLRTIKSPIISHLNI